MLRKIGAECRVLSAASLIVRAAFIAGHPLDSDELQHLHVAWASSRGLVCSRLLYRIGKPLIGARGAAIAAITFSVLPLWLPYSVEFRNDILWMFIWLEKSPFMRGICAALCPLASVKALPLFLALALAFASTRQPVAFKSLARMTAGFAIPLAIAAITFQWLGAFDAMLYPTLFYNVSLPVHAAQRIGGAISFGVIAPVLALRVPERLRNAHLAFFALSYPIIVLGCWPSITPRDFLPLVPLGALFIGEFAPVAVAREPSRTAIDGVPYAGPRFLVAGRHSLISIEHNVRVVWRAARTNR